MGTVNNDGDYAQIGTGHQIVHYHHYTININVNASSSQQEPGSISASGDLQQVLQSLQQIVAAAAPPGTATQGAPTTQSGQPTGGMAVPAITNSDGILGHDGEEILPGNIIKYGNTFGIYLGEKEITGLEPFSRRIVRSKLDFKELFARYPYPSDRHFPRDYCLQRALDCIGEPWPVRERILDSYDFVCWVCTRQGDV